MNNIKKIMSYGRINILKTINLIPLDCVPAACGKIEAVNAINFTKNIFKRNFSQFPTPALL